MVNSIDPGILANEASAAAVLEEMGSFRRGYKVETEGMLSGSGYAIYHQDATIVTKLTARLKAGCGATSRLQ